MARPQKGDDQLSVPVAIRVTDRMTKRLQRLTAADGLSQQEHIRRAIDIYLNGMEKSLSLPPLPPNPAALKD